MKKTNQYLILAACALGVVALSNNLTAENTPATCPAAMGCCSGPMAGCSMGMAMPMADTAATNTNGVPDLLKKCPVSGEKLGGDMGEPYVFSYQKQEVKLCCKSCKKDFDKTPEKYMKLIRAADKK